MLVVIMKETVEPKVVVIGGGTGTFAVLSGLRDQPISLTAIVNMADDGGSTGVLRDDMGVLPPGDVRKCLVALSDASEQLRELFNYRYSEGSLSGHSFGNLFLSTVEKMTNDFNQAVRLSGEVLRIKGSVVPITLDDVRLRVVSNDGKYTVRGQGKIDAMTFGTQFSRPHICLEPAGRINPLAVQAIANADLIVIAPGDIYTSLAALLVVDGVGEALATAAARILYVCNLVVKPAHTAGFTVADHAAEIERFAGSPIVDEVLYNSGRPPAALLQKYTEAGELLVTTDAEQLARAHYASRGRSLISADVPETAKGDRLAARRSFIRHDNAALAEAIMEYLREA